VDVITFFIAIWGLSFVGAMLVADTLARLVRRYWRGRTRARCSTCGHPAVMHPDGLPGWSGCPACNVEAEDEDVPPQERSTFWIHRYSGGPDASRIWRRVIAGMLLVLGAVIWLPALAVPVFRRSASTYSATQPPLG
jgi:hypothetical protein